MGYEMYRLLNYASDPTVKDKRKKTKKKPKSTAHSDDDISDSEDERWMSKKTRPRTDAATIEKYRK